MKKYIVIMKNGSRHEVNTNEKPQIEFNKEARQVHIQFGYEEFPFFVMQEIAACVEVIAEEKEVVE